MELIKAFSVQGEGGGSPYAVVGVEENGVVWYGLLRYDGQAKDGGPSAVVWRRIDMQFA